MSRPEIADAKSMRALALRPMVCAPGVWHTAITECPGWSSMRPVHLVADGRAAIPLTMIGGPAGAGKTAVIHNLLELTTNRRVTAVVSSTPKVTWETTSRPRDGGAGLVWDNGNTSIV